MLSERGYHEIDVLCRWFHPEQCHGCSATGDQMDLTPEEAVPFYQNVQKQLFNPACALFVAIYTIICIFSLIFLYILNMLRLDKCQPKCFTVLSLLIGSPL